MKKKILFILLAVLLLPSAMSQDEHYWVSSFNHTTENYGAELIPNYFYQWGNPLYDADGNRWPFNIISHCEHIISYQTNREFLLPLTAPFTLGRSAGHRIVVAVDSSMLGWRDAMQRVDVPYPLMVLGLAARFSSAKMAPRLYGSMPMPVNDSLLMLTFDELGNPNKMIKIPWFADDTIRKVRYVQSQLINNTQWVGCSGWISRRDQPIGTSEYYFDEPIKVHDTCYIGSTQWGSYWNNINAQLNYEGIAGGVSNAVPLYAADNYDGEEVWDEPKRYLAQYDCPMWDSVQCMFKDFDGNWHYVKRVARIDMWLIIDTTMLGIGEAEPEYGLVVSPNPATTVARVTAEVPIRHVMVYDQMGRLMYRDEHDTEELLLNVGRWPKGMYVMRIHLEGTTKQYVQKLIVQ